MGTLGTIGVVLLVGGIIALIWGAMEKFKAGRIMKTPFIKTGEAAKSIGLGEKGAVSVEGNVLTTTPLLSPVTGVPCLFYEITVKAAWKAGETEKTKDIHSEKRAAGFMIDDGSGAVQIDASKGDFDTEQTYSKTKDAGLVGSITGTDLVFENFKVASSAAPMGAKFTVVEKVFKDQPKLYACGKGENGVIGSPNWASLILSPKTRDELGGAAAKSAQMFLMGGGGAAVVGLILGLISRMA